MAGGRRDGVGMVPVLHSEVEWEWVTSSAVVKSCWRSGVDTFENPSLSALLQVRRRIRARNSVVRDRIELSTFGIYHIVARRGRQMRRDRLPAPIPAPLQPHLARSRRSRTGPDGAERVDLPADTPPLRRQRPRRPRSPHLRPHHDRHMTTPAATPPAPTRAAALRAGFARCRAAMGTPFGAHARPSWSRFASRLGWDIRRLASMPSPTPV
jgi:hypothetical protein